jgi:hypothetical protein
VVGDLDLIQERRRGAAGDALRVDEIQASVASMIPWVKQQGKGMRRCARGREQERGRKEVSRYLGWAGIWGRDAKTVFCLRIARGRVIVVTLPAGEAGRLQEGDDRWAPPVIGEKK